MKFPFRKLFLVVCLFGVTISSVYGQLTLDLSSSTYAGGYNISRYGYTNGAIDLTVSNGASPYTYLWSNAETTEDISGLSAGAYSVIVTDDASAIDTAYIILTQPDSFYAQVYSYNLSCYQSNDGNAMAYPYGGVTPYKYLFSNSDTMQSTSGLLPGNHNVWVIDATNDSLFFEFTISEPTALDLVLTPQVQWHGYNTNCWSIEDGFVDLEVSGGTHPYNYQWGTGSTNQDLSGVNAGLYTLTVTDANGCEAFDTIIITAPPILQASFQVYQYPNNSPFSCDTCNDAKLYLQSIWGGISPYGILWSTGSTSDTIYGVYADSIYSVTITDTVGCTFTDSGSIPRPTAPNDLIVVVEKSQYPGGYNISSHGINDGWINLDVNGGVQPYTYIWATGDTTGGLDSLYAGMYSVTVTDALGENVIKNITLLEPSGSLSLMTGYNFTNCNGIQSGTLNAFVNGGTPPYNYFWTDTLDNSVGINMPMVSIDSSSVYNILVVDANNDSVSDFITVSPVAPMSITLSADVDSFGYHITCPGQGETANIQLQVEGGVSPYSFDWSNGSFSQNLNNVSAGWYSVRVTGMGGCQVIDSIQIIAPEHFTWTPNIHTYLNGGAFSCDTCNDAIMFVQSISGGIPPYSILWSTGSTNDSIFNVFADSTYSISIVDSLGCTINDSGSIPRNPPTGGPLDVIATISQYPGGYNVSCNTCTDGWVELHVTGGQPIQEIQWQGINSPGYLDNNDKNAYNLAPGTYIFMVLDVSGIEFWDTLHLTAPAGALDVSLGKFTNGCDASSGFIYSNVMGGTPPYNYVWYDEYWNELYHYMPQYDFYGFAMYNLIVTDANGGIDTASITIGQPSPLSVAATAIELYGTAHTGCGTSEGQIEIAISGGTSPYMIKVSITGERFGYVSDPSGEPGVVYSTTTSNSMLAVDGLGKGTYLVSITGNSGMGCSALAEVEIQEPKSPKIKLVGNEYPNGYYTSCDTCNDGDFTIQASNTHGNVSYYWIEADSVSRPNFWIKGASLSMPPDDISGDDIDPNTIIATQANIQGLSPETWYYGVVMDEASCIVGQSLNFEKPFDAPAWKLGGNSGQNNWLGTNDNTDMSLRTQSMERMIITADGNIGIGTSNPQAKLQVNGTTRLSGEIYFDGFNPSGNTNLLTLTNGGLVQMTSLFTIPNCTPVLTWTIPPDGNQNNITTCWWETQNVGIGFINPTHTLHVDGTLRVNDQVGINTDAGGSAMFKSYATSGYTAGEFTHSNTNGISATFGSQGNKLYIVPSLSVDGYNDMAESGDAGIFWSDGNSGGGQNSSSGLVISPHSGSKAGLRLTADGKVNIGSPYAGINHADYKLGVNGKVLAKEIFVTLDYWADFVFAEEYKLRSLNELDIYIKEHKHLPDVPSEKDVLANGSNLGVMDAVLLQKVEELTLYLIELNQKLENVNVEFEKVKSDNEELKIELEKLRK